MQMLANGGVHNGERIMGRKTIDLMRTNTITDQMIYEDYWNSYLAGYGYGYGVRTMSHPMRVNTTVLLEPLAGPEAREHGLRLIRRRAFRSCTCIICSLTLRSITISACALSHMAA